MLDIDWDKLAYSMRKGNCVLVLGPEIPANRPKGGGDEQLGGPITCAAALGEQLKQVLKDVKGYTAKATTLAGIAQEYFDEFHQDASKLQAQATNFYENSRLEPSSVHRQIASLPFPLILSTCHDGLLIKALREVGKNPTFRYYNMQGNQIANQELTIPNSEQKPIIYNLFGDCEEQSSLVISENDLLDFLIAVNKQIPPLPEYIAKRINPKDKSLLFIGFDMQDWYLRILLKALVRWIYSKVKETKSTFALKPFIQKVDTKKRKAKKKDLTILFYERGTRVDICEEDIDSFLIELKQKLEKKGGYDPQAKPPGPSVFICHASQNRGLAHRLRESLHDNGLNPVLHREKLKGGQKWVQEIEDQINSIDFVVVLETPELKKKVDSDVSIEIDLALALDRQRKRLGISFLIPLLSESFDVFLSHNSQDKPIVRKLAQALKLYDLRVWLDEEQLVPGHPWQEGLETIIQTTQAAAVLIGESGMGPWEDPEMRACLSEFVKRKLPVIPILLPGIPAAPKLPLFLQSFTWVDLRDGLNDPGLEKLVWGITGVKSTKPARQAGGGLHPDQRIQELSKIPPLNLRDYNDAFFDEDVKLLVDKLKKDYERLRN